MRRYLMLGLLALGLAMPVAQAQRSSGSSPALQTTIQIRSGTYAVRGRDPQGQNYEGAAQIEATGPNTWRVTWRVAGETAQGVGFTIADAFVVGYISGREVGVVMYGPDNGNFTGIWTQGPDGGLGAETLMPR